jgi:ABC-type transport system involved in cytochrome c biogenesis permease component
LCVCGTMVSAFSMYVKKKSFVLTSLFFPILLPITVPIISLNIKLIEGQIISNGLYEIIFLLAHLVLMSSILFLIAEDLLYD